MKNTINIHDTAFMTSMFRAMNEPLSNDSFSKLWSNANTKMWVDAYLKEVSEEEVKTHCVRNRFFLEKIKELSKNNKIDLVINFGAGFSMYPFLLNESLAHIEIDTSEIIALKKQKISDWMEKGILPKRNIHFIKANFSKNYEKKLFSKLEVLIKGKSLFVLIEGVLFFLNKNESEKIFSFFDKIQCKGDYIGSVSFNHSIRNTRAFKRLIHFFNKKIVATSAENYLTLNNSFYTEKSSYKIQEHRDYFMYSEELNNKIDLKVTDVLNENYYLLQKTQ